MYNSYYTWFKYLCLLAVIDRSPEDGKDSTVIVQLPSGKLRGRVLKTPNGNTFYAFQQIPYAAPPMGNLRFKEPQPVRRWRGILDATNNTKVCHQGGMYQDDRETEDCLHLNIYVPKPQSGECKYMPVMFYIFGGAFNAGHGGYDFYGPELFMDQGVIVVTHNYRTGALGFLTTEDNVIPPNLGLKDQLFALKWVNENIEIFGGNASEITVMAHSSGAGAASYHLHSRESSGLFRAMILQSGTSLSPGMVQKFGKYFAYEVGKILSPDFGPRNTSQDLLDMLMQLPATMFRDFMIDVPLHMKNSIANNSLVWAPVIESEDIRNAFVLGPMHDNIKYGYFNQVPTLMGIVTQEEAEFITQTVPENEVYRYDEDPSLLICSTINIREEYKESMGRELRSIYTNGNFSDDYDAFLNFYSSERFSTPVIRHADIQAPQTDIYFYQFSYVGELGRKSEIMWRGPRMVVHAEELAYIFFEKDTPNFDKYPRQDVLISDRVIKMWTNFIKYLNPTPEYDPLLQNVIWPTVKPNNFVFLDIGNDLILQKDPKEYSGWKRVYDKYVDGPLDVY